jgi:hypothetical protein
MSVCKPLFVKVQIPLAFFFRKYFLLFLKLYSKLLANNSIHKYICHPFSLSLYFFFKFKKVKTLTNTTVKFAVKTTCNSVAHILAKLGLLRTGSTKSRSGPIPLLFRTLYLKKMSSPN